MSADALPARLFARLWRSAFRRFVFGAAFEGVAVMRREPGAVFSWIGVWTFALATIAIIKTLSGGAPIVAGAAVGSASLARSFGPLAILFVPVLLVLWIMTTATVFRAVIRPDEHGWHLLKLGPDEARLGVITAIAFGLVVIFGSGPALILFAMAKPVLAAVPAMGRWIVFGGAVATVALDFLIAVRLSLVAVHTFAEGRFHVFGYWRLTRRHFWRLLASYVIVFLQITVFLVVLGALVVLFTWAAMSVGTPHGADLARRALLLIYAVIAALLSASLFVIPSTIISACQAFAYKAIIAEGAI